MRAEQLDPGCAMCVWGEAWSRGPTINYTINKAEQTDLAALTDKAAPGASSSLKERALIAALQTRYHGGGGKDAGDVAVARAMDDLAKSYPSDNEIAVIAADAWMIPASRKDNRDHLDRAIALLQGVLVRSPKDTGAIHFYIHATKMDGRALQALPYAPKLQALAPSASHLVHMPSHTYFWAGWYRRAEQSDLDAVALDKVNADWLKPKDGVFGLSYHGHRVRFDEASALMGGDAKGALSLASSAVVELSNMKTGKIWDQIGLGTAYVAYGRFGTQTEVGGLADPGAAMPYAEAMWRHARGDAAAVTKEASLLKVAPDALVQFGDFEPQGRAMVTIAQLVLTGRTAMLEALRRCGDCLSARRRLAGGSARRSRRSARVVVSIRRSVAAALLAEGRPEKTVVEAQKAMARWPYDPLALKILSEGETAQGRAAAAAPEIALARTNWSGDLSAMPIELFLEA